MPNGKDVKTLRELARQVARIAAKSVQDERRELWRRHNSLQRTRPLVLSLGMPFWEEWFPDQSLQCQDPLFRAHERSLRQKIFQDELNDDTVMEPWINVKATYQPPTGDCRWGPQIRFSERTAPRGAFAFRPCVEAEQDFAKLVFPRHAIDEEDTARNFGRMQDAIGDILTVNLDRGPFYHENQAVPYSKELADPAADGRPVARDKLWVFCASQETTLVSPAMFDEFMLAYQAPIISKFGLIAYGCCEDLTRKIGLLKKIPNMRRISVTPWADMPRCVEQIGQEYVLSWRPNPAEVICRGLDVERIRRITTEGLKAAAGCHVDITIKDHETLPAGPDSLIECIRIMKNIAEDHG
jgi:hypothetical protein